LSEHGDRIVLPEDIVGDLLDEFGIPLDEYPRRCVNQIAGWEELRERLEDPDAKLTVRRSEEYGAGIIHSTVTGEPRV
ncbi:hypothetical protein GN156_38375, partial [bacterium LRH843]|nr:hypothetical protein [bacterium LRH843]